MATYSSSSYTATAEATSATDKLYGFRIEPDDFYRLPADWFSFSDAVPKMSYFEVNVYAEYSAWTLRAFHEDRTVEVWWKHEVEYNMQVKLTNKTNNSSVTFRAECPGGWYWLAGVSYDENLRTFMSNMSLDDSVTVRMQPVVRNRAPVILPAVAESKLFTTGRYFQVDHPFINCYPRFDGSFSVTTTGVPQGMSYNSQKHLHGVPEVAVSGNVVLTATNSIGTGTHTMPYVVQSPKMIMGDGTDQIKRIQLGTRDIWNVYLGEEHVWGPWQYR